MAKKIRKTKPSLARVFFLLLIPWIVMGAVAVILISAGTQDYVALFGGLAASLVVTFLIRRKGFRRADTN